MAVRGPAVTASTMRMIRPARKLHGKTMIARLSTTRPYSRQRAARGILVVGSKKSYGRLFAAADMMTARCFRTTFSIFNVLLRTPRPWHQILNLITLGEGYWRER